MGAMGTFTLLAREDLDKSPYDIDKIIFDSPLSNIEKTLLDRAEKMGLPAYVFEQTFELLNQDTKGFASKMKASELLKGSKIPMFFIQSRHDQATPFLHTSGELEKLNSPLITTWYMDSAAHVKVYTNPLYKQMYEDKVNDFIRKQ